MNEADVEEAALEYLRDLGYATQFGPNVGPGGVAQERDYPDVFLIQRLEAAMVRLNPAASPAVIAEALKRLQRPESQNLLAENARVHRLLLDGVPVETRDANGKPRTTHVKLIDFDAPEANEFFAVNQLTVMEGGHHRRADIVVFINGLPLALMELKNPTDEDATLRAAWNQIQTYRNEIPSLFLANEIVVIGDGTSAAMSTFPGGFEHYAPWKTIDGRDVVSGRPALEVLIRGAFDKRRFLDLVRDFVVFSREPKGMVKRIAKYHQYWAVQAAVESTVRAAGPDGDRRGGVVWHTQGSGKSIEMLMYAARIMRDPRMGNPTLVFITDRNDLDDQLFKEVFAPAEILPETPEQAETRADLRDKLRRASGGIVFTTLQKFAPEKAGDTNPVLTDRRNVVVIADEAHRSQYGFGETLTKDGRIKSGLAKHLRDALPGATFLGFTGTPIESTDKSTRAVFGDYIDIYDITRAVEDGATVSIYYESRLVKVSLDKDDYAALDTLVDEVTENSETDVVTKAKSRWARVEAIVGADERLDMVARDIVDHWEKRREAMLGKGMIVTMSRRIAVELYARLVALRPEWHSDDPATGKIKVIMTGSAADPQTYQPHIYPKNVRDDIKARAKDPDDELELVIVRDMWLTGFDSPPMHTMYVDKPMQGAGLMQAIARVNRTFRDKPGGLVVDYIGVATSLRSALSEYSPSDRDHAGVPLDELINAMLEKHDVVRGLVHRCEYDSSPKLSPGDLLQQRATLMDFVMSDPDLQARFLDQVLALVKAYVLCAATDQAVRIRNDVRLFTDVRTAILKVIKPDQPGVEGGPAEIDTAIGQLVNEAVSADEVLDVYRLAGLDQPEISLLSDEFLDSLAKRDKPNLQFALLRRLLNDQIRTMSRSNIVQSRKFSDLLDEAVNRYNNRSLTTAEIIAELVELAKEMRDEAERHKRLGLSVAEAALYDAIVQNDSAVLEMGDETLRKITINLVHAVRSSATIDWSYKESVRAEMRSKVRRLLAKYDYPPDKQAQAIELVLEQAELMAENETP